MSRRVGMQAVQAEWLADSIQAGSSGHQRFVSRALYRLQRPVAGRMPMNALELECSPLTESSGVSGADQAVDGGFDGCGDGDRDAIAVFDVGGEADCVADHRVDD